MEGQVTCMCCAVVVGRDVKVTTTTSQFALVQTRTTTTKLSFATNRTPAPTPAMSKRKDPQEGNDDTRMADNPAAAAAAAASDPDPVSDSEVGLPPLLPWKRSILSFLLHPAHPPPHRT